MCVFHANFDLTGEYNRVIYKPMGNLRPLVIENTLAAYVVHKTQFRHLCCKSVVYGSAEEALASFPKAVVPREEGPSLLMSVGHSFCRNGHPSLSYAKR